MRLTSLLFRGGRRPQNEKKVPFKELLTLKLRDTVSPRQIKTTEHGCLYEVSLLLSCLEENNFEEKKCTLHIKELNACYSKYSKNVESQHTEQEQIVPVPNSKNLTHKQVKYMLRRYPTI